MRKVVHYPLKIDADNIEQIRATLADSIELLKQNQPDTFLGRKTYEPFPSEDKATEIDGVSGSDGANHSGGACNDG